MFWLKTKQKTQTFVLNGLIDNISFLQGIQIPNNQMSYPIDKAGRKWLSISD